jgi:hypothetical protein
MNNNAAGSPSSASSRHRLENIWIFLLHLAHPSYRMNSGPPKTVEFPTIPSGMMLKYSAWVVHSRDAEHARGRTEGRT